MKTLYVSDLDGTLLRQNERTSDHTNAIINQCVQDGMLFSYATARSWHTAKKATRGLDAPIPLIVYNGAFIVDNATGKILLANTFGKEGVEILEDLFAHDIVPIVYALIDGQEKFSFLPPRCTPEMNRFLATRKVDVRSRAVSSLEQLKQGEIFYLTCIGQEEKLKLMYARYRDRFHCVFQNDLYTNDPWLEIMPQAASKSNAATQLKEKLGCDRLVVFGDGMNDLDLFEKADESYAVQNAVVPLKQIATGIVPSNEEDGVAMWLERNWNHEHETI
ncbi:HAD-IIB family hydrolase [uncultured Dubosiella sp.]|uniref:HAD-IIB family hydrolase n=1 Tax=uncultured Dubosiella sp. TaxID=1937011 RepID=UPI002594F614|nr:HAD-IIB family hydrolase [uncultured Dubosiella sp.]